MARKRTKRKLLAKKATTPVVEVHDEPMITDEEDEITTLDEVSSTNIVDSNDKKENIDNDNVDESESDFKPQNYHHLVEGEDDDDNDRKEYHDDEIEIKDEMKIENNKSLSSSSKAESSSKYNSRNETKSSSTSNSKEKSNKRKSLSKPISSNSNSNKKSSNNNANKSTLSLLKESESKKRENLEKGKSSKSNFFAERSSKHENNNYSKKHSDDSQNSKSESLASKDYDEAYFKRMHHRAQDKFHDPTDKELFIENLMNNIKDKEMKLCKYRYSSSCIIWLIENLENQAILKKFIEKIVPEQFTMDFVTDDNSGAVLESIFETIIKELSREENFETETSKWIIKWLDGVAKFVMENLNSLMKDATEYGNNLLITMIEALGGMRIGRFWNRKNMRFGSGIKIDLEAIITSDMAFKEIPQLFKHYLKRLTKSIVLDCSDDECRETIFARCTNVAQYLLFILKVRYPELCQMVVKKLVGIVFANDENRDSICQSANGAYIVEILLLVASESRLSKIWTKHLKSNVKQFWKHDISQFVIQRLIDAIKEENLFIDVARDLFPDLEEMFKCSRPGIGVGLAKTCQDQPKMQLPFLMALMKAFDCYEPKDKQLDIVPQMLFYESKFIKSNNQRTPRSGRNNLVPIWLYGSLMLQHMFGYKDPYKLSKSLLSMSITDVMRTCQDRSGSHVIDCFLQSNTVELKHKSELVERLLGNYSTLACDKYGSRIVENIMELSNQEVRATITAELSQNEAMLMSNRNGWFVAKNAGLYHFKKRPNDWRDVERNRMKRKREFEDFISIKHRPGRGRGSFIGSGGDRRRDSGKFNRDFRGRGRRF